MAIQQQQVGTVNLRKGHGPATQKAQSGKQRDLGHRLIGGEVLCLVLPWVPDRSRLKIQSHRLCGVEYPVAGGLPSR